MFTYVALFFTIINIVLGFQQILVKDDEFVHHYHLPKTGGTTFRVNIPHILGLRGCNVSQYSNRSGFFAELDADLKKRQCQFTSFELPYHDMHDDLPTHYSIIFFREPHRWLWSAIFHDFFRGRKYIANGERNFTLYDIENGNKSPWYPYANFQTRYLISDIDEYTLTKTQKIMDSFDVVGIAEYFHESMCVLTYKFSQMEFFNKYCECSSRPASSDKRSIGYSTTNTAKEVAQAHLGFWGNNHDLTSIQDMVKVDDFIYSQALNRFMNDVREVEKASGKRIFCPFIL